MFCKKKLLISDKLDISEASFRVLHLVSKFYIAVYVYDEAWSLFDTLLNKKQIYFFLNFFF